MKTYFTLFFCLTVVIVFGQTPIEVKIIEHHSSLGKQTAFEVMVPQSTSDDAIDLWKKTISPDGLFKKSVKIEKVKELRDKTPKDGELFSEKELIEKYQK